MQTSINDIPIVADPSEVVTVPHDTWVRLTFGVSQDTIMTINGNTSKSPLTSADGFISLILSPGTVVRVQSNGTDGVMIAAIQPLPPGAVVVD